MALMGKDRCAVVTGANKGIGFEICKQLASNGVKVVLTSRDDKRGIDALEKFKGTHLSDLIIFHQLDVTDPNSVASLAQFVKNQFGKLDILVNNCGIGGVVRDEEAFRASKPTGNETDINYNMGVLSTEDGAETPVKIALFPDGGPSGCFFDRDGVIYVNCGYYKRRLLVAFLLGKLIFNSSKTYTLLAMQVKE
ncbi:hypothetical protein L1887_34087 [Cichorium endivia]|nr:hypothetical protein L1887_34087 [Cichorium endivia]